MNKDTFFDSFSAKTDWGRSRDEKALRSIAATWRELAAAQQEAGLCEGTSRLRVDLRDYFNDINEKNGPLQN